ncbi:hypothetical protein [Synechococcus sp. CCY 9618]|uniref:hypothetical protein n=1 Tax=Synechococcus sp. CCY 9618 TaxID=2815602 RepID=UPI001C21AD43|nr:hypothetical protein [Synechococcus sp. CCY 9618]
MSPAPGGPRLWTLPLASGGLLLAGAIGLQPHGDLLQADNLAPFLGSAAVMGTGFVLSWFLPRIPSLLFWSVAIACRLVVLAMEPGDDIWRYLWEGLIQNQGFNPYLLPPEAPVLSGLRTAWWPLINHPDTSAIYPPLAQLGFRGLAAIAPAVLLFKATFLVADLGLCALLSKSFGIQRAALYAWNPLAIYAVSGGGHYESWFLLPLVAGWLVAEGRLGRGLPWPWLWSTLLLGISVALKWVSMPLLGYGIWQSLRQGRPVRAGLVGMLGLLPLVLSSLAFGHGGSWRLLPTDSVFMTRGRSAEWIPHLVGQVWPWTLRSNAPYGLALLLAVVLLLAFSRSLRDFAWGYWLALLLLSPIVHAWYFLWLLPFAVPDQNWGARLVSLSAFLYFVLPSRAPQWMLTEPERWGLWLPLILGCLLSARQARSAAPATTSAAAPSDRV